MSEETVGSRRLGRLHGVDLDRHESHGLIQLNRYSGGGNLHAMPVKVNGGMSITITECHTDRHDALDHHSQGNVIAEVHLSDTQFAEFITTPNQGQGVPCTLKHYRDGDTLKRCEEPPPFVSPARDIRDTFKGDVEAATASMKAVRRRIGTLLEKPRATKGEREEALREIDELMRLFTDTAPWAMEQFEQAAHQTVATAKGEMAAAADNIARSVGLAQLKAPSVRLLEDGDE